MQNEDDRVGGGAGEGGGGGGGDEVGSSVRESGLDEIPSPAAILTAHTASAAANPRFPSPSSSSSSSSASFGFRFNPRLALLSQLH